MTDRRDIDCIVERVKERIPGVIVDQLTKIHPADDDGLWWFRLPGIKKDIQIESSSGSCPFIVESDDFSSTNAKTAHTIDEAVLMIIEYLHSLAGS